MPITFDVDLFRSETIAAGHQTIEQISEATGLDIAVLSRLLKKLRQPTFATAARCARPYTKPLGDYVHWSADSEAELEVEEVAA
jgi:transcriptional regulator with XRE-family HTH domain